MRYVINSKNILKVLFSATIIVLMGFLFACKKPVREYRIEYLTSIGGTVVGDPIQIVKSGEDATTVIAVSNEGYEFVSWSDGIETADRTDFNITKSMSVTAKFERISYKVEYKTDGNGTINGEAVQMVDRGRNATTVVAVPNEGYEFVGWSDGIKTADRTDFSIIQDISVTAKFERISYKVEYKTDGNGTINGEARQTIKFGENATSVTAVPNRGYRFIKWSDGDTNATRYDFNIISENVYVAEFEFLFAGGEGTEENPFKIENYTQLTNMSYFPYDNYELINNLDLTNIEHEPIFDDENRFCGIFDGSNKTISNLSVNTQENFPSLLGFCNQTSEVKNLNLTNANIVTTDFNTMAEGQYCVGVVAGLFEGRLTNVNVGGTICADGLSFDGVAIGGLVGWGYYSTIMNCHADVCIIVSNVQRDNSTGITIPFSFGGLLGVCSSAALTGCSASGEIQMSQSNYNLLCGGLIGYYSTSQNSTIKISDCSADMMITGDNDYQVGGFVGSLDVASDSNLIIESCFAKGNKIAGYVGGFINECKSNGKLQIRNCYAQGDIIGSEFFAGFIGFLYGSADSKNDIKNCYFLGNIESNDENDGNCAGFIYDADYSDFVFCYASGNIFAKEAVGFGRNISDCNLNGCSFSGEIRATRFGNGFCSSLYYSKVQNCYSTGNINFIEAGNINATYGFIGTLGRNSTLENSYYSGSVVDRPIIGLVSDESEIINFHTICPQQDEQKIIGNNRNETDVRLEVNVYHASENMHYLADILNADSDEAIWVNVENDFPKLKFMQNTKNECEQI